MTADYEPDPCEEGCDPASVQQVAIDEDQCSDCGRRGPIGGAA